MTEKRCRRKGARVTAEPANDRARVRAILHAHFTTDATNIHPLTGGVFSRAFAFTANDRAYVIRLSDFGHAAESFAKDAYAGRHFASPTLPIPIVVARGMDADTFYVISERAAGHTLELLSPPARQSLLRAILDTLDAIAHADVHGTSGYGDWDSTGTGEAATWHDYLAAIIENRVTGFYRHWHALFRDSFLEREAYEMIYHEMLRLAMFCSEERALIHNDFHFANVLADGHHITGVIDWGNALYGDPLHEIAQLAWWSSWPGWWYDNGAALLRQRYGDAPHYDERIACYTCHVALDELRYNARIGNRTQYERVRDRILARIASGVSST
jgi:hygromycin-B 4-O-kinase